MSHCHGRKVSALACVTEAITCCDVAGHGVKHVLVAQLGQNWRVKGVFYHGAWTGKNKLLFYAQPDFEFCNHCDVRAPPSSLRPSF